MRKNNWRKLPALLPALALILVLLPGTALAVPAPGTPFTDVSESDWFTEDVAWVYEKNLFIGMGETQFSPQTPMTRGMLATVLFRLDEPARGPNTTGFTDVPLSAWYSDAVAWASANGIVTGYDAAHFGPEDNVTREQLAAVLYRYMNYAGIVRPVTEQYILFADEAQISGYAKEPIQTLYKLGIIRGVEDNTIDPKAGATRAEVSAVLHRFAENVTG
jgi:hypothetical protein